MTIAQAMSTRHKPALGGMELIARDVSNAVSTKSSNCEVHDLLKSWSMKTSRRSD
jgi:hypothetical protein